MATNDAVDTFGRLNSTEICISATNRKFPGRVRRIKSTVYLARLLTVARGPTCKRIEADEIWSFVYAKERNVPEAKNGKFGVGDVWTWVALDADTKLCVSYLIGERDAGYANIFMQDVADRVVNRIQLTTDGLRSYQLLPDSPDAPRHARDASGPYRSCMGT
ncbi:MAG TPA: hypothetical protein VIM11_28170 [Tepidisphaeraceae bacterium]